jgi:transposase
LIVAHDPCVGRVARHLRTDRKTVRLWRDRYLVEGIDGLKDRGRCGRPIEIDGVTRCIVLSIACGKPVDAGLAFRETWTLDTLLEATNACQRVRGGDLLSRTSVFRILNDADFRPHRMRYWLHSPDPAFREKVTKICELYLHRPAGSTVLCIDEKTGMQALGRKHPSRLPEPGRQGRLEYEYIRRGTRALIAAFNPHTGKVFGHVRPRRGAVELVTFMEEIARRYPTGDIHIIWDNLNTHFDGKDQRWTRFNKRHGHRFHFHYTPIHASWVNQVELFFGILHRRLLRYTVYPSVAALEDAVRGFLGHWNRHEAHPFRWTFKGYPLQRGSAAA